MDPKLEQAIQAIKSGDKSAGMVLLAQVIRSDPNNESAWIWMATAQDDPEKKKQSLERVLRINPANERVRRALAVMFPTAVQAESAQPTVEAEPAPSAGEQVSAELPAVPSESAAEVGIAQPETAVPAPAEEKETPTVDAAQPAAPEPGTAAEETPSPAMPEMPAAEATTPDLSWLKETAFAPEEPKEESSDLSWLKEDLPTETPAAEAETGLEAAQDESAHPAWLEEQQTQAETKADKEEPSSDLDWSKEAQPPQEKETGFTWPAGTEAEKDLSNLDWLREEQPAAGAGPSQAAIPAEPTAKPGDIEWLHAASASPAGEPTTEGKPDTEEPDFSWLAGEPAEEGKPAVEAQNEPAFPWLEQAAPAEEQAVKNEQESLPEWLRQGSEAQAEPGVPVSMEAGQPEGQASPTLESEPLSPEEFDVIASKPAELPFTWDEVTGEPVMKSEAEMYGEKPAALPSAETAQAPAVGSGDVSAPPIVPAASTTISRPGPLSTTSAPARVAPAAAPSGKKGMTTGQIILLVFLGLATLVVVLAFGFYLAVNFGWLKAFGF